MVIARKWSQHEKDREDFETLVDYNNAEKVIITSEERRLAFERHHGNEIPHGTYPEFGYEDDPDADPILSLIGNSAALGKTTAERYQKYLSHVRRNRYFKWLSANPQFKKAHNLFRQKQKAVKRSGYHFRWAELRFLKIATLIGRYLHLKHIGYQPKDPTARQVTQAIARAKLLQASIATGVRFETEEETSEFTRMLNELVKKLKADQEKGYKKPHLDEHRIGREFITIVSSELIEEFGEASPGIVIGFARIMGYEADETSIERQIARVRREYPVPIQHLLIATKDD